VLARRRLLAPAGEFCRNRRWKSRRRHALSDQFAGNRLRTVQREGRRRILKPPLSPGRWKPLNLESVTEATNAQNPLSFTKGHGN